MEVAGFHPAEARIAPQSEILCLTQRVQVPEDGLWGVQRGLPPSLEGLRRYLDPLDNWRVISTLHLISSTEVFVAAQLLASLSGKQPQQQQQQHVSSSEVDSLSNQQGTKAKTKQMGTSDCFTCSTC